ncbi:MAG: adenosylcobinamide-GDP ribazoletransferase [Nitrospirales bacterium]|nr:MAG: adenosylcobinamide-GDP ribazoletransferase [Nitrospirales bacterium]
MKGLWQSFSLAWNFLTILPLPFSSQSHVQPQTIAASFGWYPFVGFLLGTILVLSDRLLMMVLSEPVANMLLLSILVMVTGALHQDGLADTIDAMAGGKDPHHRLAIMRDSHIGAIGATGLILAIGLRYAGLVNLPSESRESLLLCMPALGRWSMVMASWNVTYPRPDGGVAAAFIQFISVRDVFMATMIMLIGLMWAIHPLKAIVLLFGIMLMTRLIVWWASRAFGGVTGDILGTINEVIELIFLVSAPWFVGNL